MQHIKHSKFIINLTADVILHLSEEVNRTLPVKNTTVQLLTLYTDPECHNAQHYRQTDRQTTLWRQKPHCTQNDRLKPKRLTYKSVLKVPCLLSWCWEQV